MTYVLDVYKHIDLRHTHTTANEVRFIIESTPFSQNDTHLGGKSLETQGNVL